MRRFRFHLLLVICLVLANALPLRAATANMPEFEEVFQLIRTNAADLSAQELERAAVQGLLSALGSKVTVVTNASEASRPTEGSSVVKTEVFDGSIGYFRIARVDSRLAERLKQAYDAVNATNRLRGMVLDLRYADGTDYSGAASTAKLFIPKRQPLLNWGEGMVSTEDNSEAIRLPLAILVNGGTSAASEALAGALRFSGAGLILGSKTAGRAMVTRDFPLSNGGSLRIATQPVMLGNGTPIPSGGIKPDIEVSVSAAYERAYYADAFFVAPRTNPLASANGSLASQSGGTNGSRRVRLNEADLVREHRQGLNRPVDELPGRGPEPEVPIVSDPALARALDLLKGLAVMRQSRL